MKKLLQALSLAAILSTTQVSAFWWASEPTVQEEVTSTEPAAPSETPAVETSAPVDSSEQAVETSAPADFSEQAVETSAPADSSEPTIVAADDAEQPKTDAEAAQEQDADGKKVVVRKGNLIAACCTQEAIDELRKQRAADKAKEGEVPAADAAQQPSATPKSLLA